MKSSACVFTDNPIAVLRNYRNASNLTGRFNSPSANCVTFFGHRENMRTVLIDTREFVRNGNFLLRNEALVAYGLQPFPDGLTLA